MGSPMFLLVLACEPAADPPCCKDTDSDSDTDSDTDTDADTDTDTDTDTDSDTDTVTDTDTTPRAAPIVLLFIGDGMGFQHVAGGGLYANGAAGTLRMEGLASQGRIVTASLSGVTDSAAAGTAMSAGIKTWNDAVAMDRDFGAVETLIEAARARGLATGVITTDKLTGATPASFLAHVADRGQHEEIAAQIAASPPDILFGGATYEILPLLDPDEVDIYLTRDTLLAGVPGDNAIAGLFSSSEFPYVADGYTEQPTLAEMTQYALDALADDPEGVFLVIEGARIDHASHVNDGERVHQETAAFDEAIGAALDWADATSAEPTLIVTADHECAGLTVSGGGTAGVVPDSAWRWGQHTNLDVPVYANGRLTELFDGERLDQTWVHAVLAAAIADADAVTAPIEGALVDGRTDEIGAPIVAQAWETDFGVGYNQLDALRVTSDDYGLHIGVDGVYERDANTALILIDMDFGGGTGWAGGPLTDTEGQLDLVISGLPLAESETLGFDLVFGEIGAEEVGYSALLEYSGLRGIRDPWGTTDDLGWLSGACNFDDGNIAEGGLAPDAGATGSTEGGWEVQIPWVLLYPDGIPGAAEIAVAVVLVNEDGSVVSNQALPPYESGGSPDGVALSSVAVLSTDASGVATSAAIVSVGP